MSNQLPKRPSYRTPPSWSDIIGDFSQNKRQERIADVRTGNWKHKVNEPKKK